MYPALAVARALRDAQPALELEYVGGVRGLERRLVGDSMPYHQLVVRSLRGNDFDLHLVTDPLRLGASIPQAWLLLRRLRPAAVFSSGGYLGIPLVLAARALGIPSLVWEGNVLAGRATATVGRLATRVAVTFPPTMQQFPGHSFVSGTPIRSLDGIDRDAARANLGVGPEERLMLAFGGSQAVPRITEAVEGSLEQLLPDWHIIHVVGDDGMAAAQERREAQPMALRERYRPVGFLTEGMAEALVAADLVLGRAGSSTCAEIMAVGVASILVPYPHAGGHQRANARWLAEQDAAVVVQDAELDGPRLVAEARRLRDDATRGQMAGAAKALGRPHAARDLADELLAMASGAPLPSQSRTAG